MRTNVDSGLMDQQPANLSADVLCGQSWSALAEIGRQLQRLAQAHLGQGSFSAQPAFLHTSSPSLTLSELTNEFLRAKARAGRSDRYLAALHYSLAKFSLGRGKRELASLTTREIEDWLDGLKLKPRTLQGYLGDVRTLLNFAVRRNYLAHNPARGVEPPVFEPAPPSLHTPSQARIVLNFAREYDPHICRALAVRYFAGLRTSEVERITEADVRGHHIEVTAANAKTRRRRLVTIQDALRAWLALGGELPAPPANGRRMLEFMRALAGQGVLWPGNVTRHSFVSYHLAQFQNAGRTALEAGHTEQMLFAHYRELVTPEAAMEFWAIRPA